MKKRGDIHLLRLAWMKSILPDGEFKTSDSRVVEIIDPGDYNSQSGTFTDAKIRIDGDVYYGCIEVAHPDGEGLKYYPKSTILRVVSVPGPVVCYDDGRLVPQIILPVSDHICDKYQKLRSGSKSNQCAGILASMDPIHRLGIINDLVIDRLKTKYDELMSFHKEGENNWNHTLYVMAFRAMAGSENKEAFTVLAKTVPYTAISHERNSIETVEALLLGGAGMLVGRDEDDYMCRLNAEFDYLRRKYGITPMRPINWERGRSRPAGNPVLRIVQLAAFFARKEFVFTNIMNCDTAEDVYNIFRAEASDYWSTHYSPSKKSSSVVKRIGRDHALVLGVNLVVPLMFAYGKYMKDETLQMKAVGLLENLKPEKNSIIDKWRTAGVAMESAYDTQAILEQEKCFCREGRCAECRIGKRVIIGK